MDSRFTKQALVQACKLTFEHCNVKITEREVFELLKAVNNEGVNGEQMHDELQRMYKDKIIPSLAEFVKNGRKLSSMSVNEAYSYAVQHLTAESRSCVAWAALIAGNKAMSVHDKHAHYDRSNAFKDAYNNCIAAIGEDKALELYMSVGTCREEAASVALEALSDGYISLNVAKQQLLGSDAEDSLYYLIERDPRLKLQHEKEMAERNQFLASSGYEPILIENQQDRETRARNKIRLAEEMAKNIKLIENKACISG